jgi:hypothetical protein
VAHVAGTERSIEGLEFGDVAKVGSHSEEVVADEDVELV